MAKYKVIFRSDNKNADTAPGWEPGCPVIINAVQVSRNTGTGQCCLQLKLSNLTDEVVGRFALRAEVTYADGTAEAVEIAPLDADIRPGRAHQPGAVLLTGSDVRHVTARIASATYGNEQWMSAGKVCANTAGGPPRPRSSGDHRERPSLGRSRQESREIPSPYGAGRRLADMLLRDAQCEERPMHLRPRPQSR